MSFSVTLSPAPLPPFSESQRRQVLRSLNLNLNPLKSTPNFQSIRIHRHRFRSSRRLSDFPRGNDDLVDDPRNWSRSISSGFGGLDDDDDGGKDDDDDDDEEEDLGLNLLIKFVQSVFKKISRRARKALRSVLPTAISTNLVRFSVDGVLILAFLWVLKAFLEVVCTLGTVVFVSILLIRGMWTGISYFQVNRSLKMNDFNDENHAWSGAQPVS